MRLLQIADHIWVFPPHRKYTQPSVGIILTSTQTVLVDAGNSPSHARHILDELNSIHAPPVRYIIYTHHHWDHVLGASIFNNVPIIAHERCYDLVKSLAATPWNKEFVEAELRENSLLKPRYDGMEQALGDWNEISFVLPTMTFSQQMTLHLDGISVVLEHVGGQHAEDSIIVYVPQEHVTFLSDCFYPPPFHLRTSESAPDWSMLAKLINDHSETYVIGHDLPATRAEIQRLLTQANQ